MKTTLKISIVLLITLLLRVNANAQTWRVVTSSYSQIVPVYQDVAVYQYTCYGWQFVGYQKQLVGWQRVDCSCPAPSPQQNRNYPDNNAHTTVNHTNTKPGLDQNGNPTPEHWEAFRR